jgi:hypothetical protein
MTAAKGKVISGALALSIPRLGRRNRFRLRHGFRRHPKGDGGQDGGQAAPAVQGVGRGPGGAGDFNPAGFWWSKAGGKAMLRVRADIALCLTNASAKIHHFEVSCQFSANEC